MLYHSKSNSADLRKKIKQGKICFGGNAGLKIYGTLRCSSGKRMQQNNRVFFTSEKQAMRNGFRPCGHCMKMEYQKWKGELIPLLQ